MAFCSSDHNTASGPNCIQTSTHLCGEQSFTFVYIQWDCCVTTLPDCYIADYSPQFWLVGSLVDYFCPIHTISCQVSGYISKVELQISAPI